MKLYRITRPITTIQVLLVEALNEDQAWEFCETAKDDDWEPLELPFFYQDDHYEIEEITE